LTQIEGRSIITIEGPDRGIKENDEKYNFASTESP